MNPDKFTPEEWRELHTPAPPASPEDYVWLVDQGLIKPDPEKYETYKRIIQFAKEQHLKEIQQQHKEWKL